ncbi:class II aldolase/adducin family protein [Treponema putidum]|uniref:Class II aldolase/adducin family protein n=1 Tax=Treponema putidum TaxID=221027 RepID=A0AAE9MUR8_9SPIR|nr:class II aldolase/adducin family protein [Treponema putidum]AIN93052.1 fuculose phosphate aldolase [Treponema putidum]TWI78528.1 L-fuculose-phosphate aldolase [Treponema putidum]UTY29292.1 class II aldolase/adducin family protein [Treponema putidum]UTY31787.1 class II aldolase/adducin family protein [Treponema putidum]UTY34146.1 class II aldolase/adducin family protein [Treponema putidum]
MTLDEAKSIIIETGKRLLKSGLTVRTWGNVSMRLDDSTFAITPSGYSYENLKPEHIVVLNINKPESSGPIKPSSERFVHASLYKADKSIKFIIHTHQKFASAISGCYSSIPVENEALRSLLGPSVPVARYAPAGTKRIARHIVKCLTKPAGAVIMAQHGAVCFGANADEAFAQADALEELCRNLIFSEAPALSLAYRRHERKAMQPLINFYSSCREGDYCTVYDKNTNITVCKLDIKSGNIIEGLFDFQADLHRRIYDEYPDINFIEQSSQAAALFVSKKMNKDNRIPAFLDDFAQIAGENIFLVPFFENRAEEMSSGIVDALKNRSCVLVYESGALCCVSDKDDIKALKEILEKNLLALVLSWKFKNYFPISRRSAKKMRKGYIGGYSKMGLKI